MDTKAVVSFLTDFEFVMWLGALGAAFYGKLYRHFPAVLCFLAIKMLSTGVYSYVTVYHPPGTPGWAPIYAAFFRFFWVSYFLATLSVFFSIEQIIRTVLSPLPGLSRLAVLIFRFTGGLTLFIALTSHLPEFHRTPFPVWISALYVTFALCMCVFEVVLVLLLISTASRLGLSFRTRIFGLSLGISFLGIMDFIALALSTTSTAVDWSGMSLTNEVLTFGIILMWCAYFVLPDQRRGPLMVAGSSTLMRWNDIVNQLGVGPQPAQEGSTSFMSDVESVVERIMLRNPGHKL